MGRSRVRLRADTSTNAGRLISRDNLLERLHRARLGRVSLIEAPAGYGKTTLLSAWHASLIEQDIDAVWISLDEELSHPQRLFSAMRRAIRGIGDHPARQTREYLDRRGIPSFNPARQFAATLSSRSEPLVIILDDYHRAAAEDLDASLADFLRGLPPAVHVALSSRPLVKIPMAAMRIEATLTRLELKDMRFSDAEINELFANELSPEELASISVWTEGWPILVQLARSYLHDHLDRAGALARLSMKADQDIGGYLTEQVLGRLLPADRDILVMTSFLERLDADLVEAVTGTENVWRALERLAAIFVLVANPGDGDVSPTYRCHHLLREALYIQLRGRGHAEVLRLRAKAARWLRERGRWEDALRQGRAAGDFDLVAEILLEQGGILYGVRHGYPELRRLLEYLPPEQISRQPRLRLAQCFELAKEGRMDAARDVVRAVHGRYQKAISCDPLLARDLALAEICIAAYSGTATLSLAQLSVLERAIHDAREDDVLGRAILNNLLVAMHYQHSDFPSALAAGEAALHNYGQASASNGLAHTHLHLGLIQMELANTAEALGNFRAAKENFTNGDQADEAGCALADVLIAETLYERGHLSEARALCSSALGAMEEGEHLYSVFVSAYRTLSGIVFLQDGLSSALAFLDNATRVARRRRLIELERMLDARRTELQLQAGEFSRLDAESLERILSPCDTYERESPRTWCETDRQALLDARLMLQDGHCAAGIAQLRDLDRRCAAEGRIRSRISVLVLLAAAHYNASGREVATATMRQAIALSNAGSILRPFFEEGRAALPILVHLSVSAESRRHDEAEIRIVNELIRALHACSSVGATLFSTRELEILQQLVLGNNNKLIARALSITPHTVRFHLKKIYDKLGVSDRKVVASMTLQRGLLAMAQGDS